MEQELEWFELRLELLRRHLQERQYQITDQEEEHYLLQIRHQKERDRVILAADQFLTWSKTWSNLTARQAEEITKLLRNHKASWYSMIIGQRHEEISFKEEIERQKAILSRIF